MWNKKFIYRLLCCFIFLLPVLLNTGNVCENCKAAKEKYDDQELLIRPIYRQPEQQYHLMISVVKQKNKSKESTRQQEIKEARLFMLKKNERLALKREILEEMSRLNEQTIISRRNFRFED
jgi:hypothetical protein